MPSIYKITNNINNKMYIEKTSNSIEKRFEEHIKDSKKERCEKRPLYDAMNKYGIEHFTIEEIEQVANDEIACEREQYWIETLRTYIGYENSNGYNATLGGDSKRIYDYKLIAMKYLELQSVKDTAQFFGCDKYTVRMACKENNVQIKCKNTKPIKKSDINGENIQYFNSLTEAAYYLKDNNIVKNRSMEVIRKNISHALNSGHKAYNFIWTFI